MLRNLITLIFCATGCAAIAQPRDTIYFNNEGFSTKDKVSAAFYRVSTPKDSVAVFSFIEYRRDGSYVEARAKDNIEHPRYVGSVKLFDKQGHILELHEYGFYGQREKTMRYHPNGMLLQTLVYRNERDWPAERLIYEADSAGNANIVNGNGTHRETGTYVYYVDTVLDRYEMTGPYRNGVKEGKWTGTDNHNLHFEENYTRGKLTGGQSTNAKGRKYKYTTIFTLPDFGYHRAAVEVDIETRLANPADTIGLKRLGKLGLQIDYTIDEHGTTAELTGFRPDGTPVILRLRKPYRGLSVALARGIPVSYRVKHLQGYGYDKPVTNWVSVPGPVYIKAAPGPQN